MKKQRYYRLVVQFERDLEACRFDYLGQAFWMGHLDSLLAGCSGPFPRTFLKGFCPAEAGWKLAVAIEQALRTDHAIGAGVADITGELRSEAVQMMRALERASNLGVRFRFALEEAPDPRPALVRWVQQDMRDLVASVLVRLQNNGVRIQRSSG